MIHPSDLVEVKFYPNKYVTVTIKADTNTWSLDIENSATKFGSTVTGGNLNTSAKFNYMEAYETVASIFDTIPDFAFDN